MPTVARAAAGHSTVTDLARLRGWSTSWPFCVASSQANICSGTVATRGCSRVETLGSGMRTSAYAAPRRRRPRPARRSGAAGADLLQVGQHLVVQLVPALRRDDHEDRQAVLDQGDRAVLELAGGEALGVDVRELLELERALERDRVADVAARGTAPTARRRSRRPA